MIQSILCVPAVKNLKQLPTTSCVVTFIQLRLKLLNGVCALNGSLKNSSEEKLLNILFYGAEDFTSQLNFEILK